MKYYKSKKLQELNMQKDCFYVIYNSRPSHKKRVLMNTDMMYFTCLNVKTISAYHAEYLKLISLNIHEIFAIGR